MLDWLRPHFAEGNEIVDLFYAITDCQGWIRSTKTEVMCSSGAIATAATDGGKLRKCFAAH
jgi:hypothetical protein